MLLYEQRLVDGQIRRRAPPNTMYRVDSIAFSNKTGVAATLMVLDRWMPTDATQDVVDIDTGDVIAHCQLDIVGENYQISNLDHVTKFITITKDIVGSVSCLVSIYGDIIPATRIQLIMQWFRKGGL